MGRTEAPRHEDPGRLEFDLHESDGLEAMRRIARFELPRSSRERGFWPHPAQAKGGIAVLLVAYKEVRPGKRGASWWGRSALTKLYTATLPTFLSGLLP